MYQIKGGSDMEKKLRVYGDRLIDPSGRHRLLSGINLVCKGDRQTNDHPAADTDWRASFMPDWPQSLYDQFAAWGYTVIRLGMIWAALEPQPNHYDETYLAWIGWQLDQAERAGIGVFLDMHQDLYSQLYSDGAPDWATLTRHPFAATDLWSDAYLTSPAVQEAFDAFWANQPAPASGKGIQDHYVDLWETIARRFGDHPAVLGFDYMNEPFPGSLAEPIFGSILRAFGELAGQNIPEAERQAMADPEKLAQIFADPEQKLQALELLENRELYWALGERTREPAGLFEQTTLSDFYDRLNAAVRPLCPEALLFRENSYFSNIGVPCAARPVMRRLADGETVAEPRQVFSPHGYDLTVDTPAIAVASDNRAEVIFARHRETQQRLGVPVLVGEWGAFGDQPVALRHGAFLLDLFDENLWSHTYWCYEKGFEQMSACELLHRPCVQAVHGVLQTVHLNRANATWHVVWDEAQIVSDADLSQPSLFYLPQRPSHIELDGSSRDSWIEGITETGGILHVPYNGVAGRELRVSFGA